MPQFFKASSSLPFSLSLFVAARSPTLSSFPLSSSALCASDELMWDPPENTLRCSTCVWPLQILFLPPPPVLCPSCVSPPLLFPLTLCRPAKSVEPTCLCYSTPLSYKSPCLPPAPIDLLPLEVLTACRRQAGAAQSRLIPVVFPPCHPGSAVLRTQPFIHVSKDRAVSAQTSQDSVVIRNPAGKFQDLIPSPMLSNPKPARGAPASRCSPRLPPKTYMLPFSLPWRRNDSPLVPGLPCYTQEERLDSIPVGFPSWGSVPTYPTFFSTACSFLPHVPLPLARTSVDVRMADRWRYLPRTAT